MAFIPRLVPGEQPAGPGYENVTMPPQEILKFRILEKREACIKEIARYHYRRNRGLNSPTNRVRTTIIALYMELYSSIRRTLNKEQKENLHKNIYSSSYQEIEQAYFTLSDFLDDKRVTLFDTRKNYDPTNMEEENVSKNL